MEKKEKEKKKKKRRRRRRRRGDLRGQQAPKEPMTYARL